MNPLRLTARNYRAFSDLDLAFPEGCTAVVGPNGAGKSSIVGAIDLALFGARSLGDYLTEGIDEPLQIELEFEHRGELYRVRRSYSPKGRGQTKLDFELDGGDGCGFEVWNSLTRETAAATQELICETLGLSRETFRASAFLAQGDGAAFSEAQPRDRKRILSEVLGLGIWDELLALAKSDRGRLEAEQATLTARIGAANMELVRRPELETESGALSLRVSELTAQVAEAEKLQREGQERLTAAREAAAAVTAAQELLTAKAAQLERARARVAELNGMLNQEAALIEERSAAEKLAHRVPELEQELSQANEAETARAESRRLTDEYERLGVRLRESKDKLQALYDAPESHCDRCGQVLDGEAMLAARESLREEGGALLNEQGRILVARNQLVVPATRDPYLIHVDLDQARTAAARIGEIAARLDRLGELRNERDILAASIPDLEADHAAAQAKVSGAGEQRPVGEIARALAEVEQTLAHYRERLQSSERKLAVIAAELERLAGLAEQVADEQARLTELQAEMDVVLLAERAYGRDGIPALIVENAAIPQIETEANRILAELGTSFTVELRTQRALKSGEGLKESLDIVVAGPIGARPYETFSGGERTRLNLALRIALARLLAHRRGAEVRMLAIDEPEFLDEAGVARLAEVLRGLTPDFDRILLVSHVPGLRDAFDQAIEVEKLGERSRIVGAPEPVEVAA